MRSSYLRSLFLAVLLFCCWCSSAAADLTATTNHIYIGVANDAGVKYNNWDYSYYYALSSPSPPSSNPTNYSTSFLPTGTDPANAYLIKADGGGTNELSISATTAVGTVQNINSTISSPSGTFYVVNNGGRGFDNDLILALAVSGPIPDNFAVHITSHGYTWTPAPSGTSNISYTSVTNQTYVQGLDETFTKQDFVYGPQTVRPGTATTGPLPIYSSENGVSPNPPPTTAAYMMFIDLNVGNLKSSYFPGSTNQGAAQVDFSFSGLDVATKIAFNGYGWVSNSNQGDGINFTNAMSGTAASGYYLTVTPPGDATVTYSPTGPYKAGTSVTITATFSQGAADSPVPMITLAGADTVTAEMTKIDANHYSYSYTAGPGNGDVAVSLTATSISGTPLVSIPVTGATFTLDNTPPAIASATPADGATDVSTGSQVAVVFSEAIDATTITPDTFSISGVAGVVAYDAATLTATFTPTSPLATSTPYTVTITGARDLAGNAIVPVTWSFTTAAPPDTTPPTAAITYSPAGPYKAGTVVTLTATFSEAMADSAVPQIALSGADTLAPANMTKTDITHYSYTYTAGAGNGDVTVTLSNGTDLAGNPVVSAPTSGATFTLDNVPPSISVAVPANGATNVGKDSQIVVTFSEAMDPTSINAGTFLINGVAGSVSYDSTTWTAKLTPNAALDYSTPYTVTITGAVKDLAGNAMTPATLSFTTAAAPDTTPPTAVMTYSPAGPYKTGTVVTITATFSEAMADSPVPQIALSGADTLAAVNMVKTDVNHYIYMYTAGSGIGDVTVTLSNGTDLAGNPVVSVPTGGNTFTLNPIPAGNMTGGATVTIADALLALQTAIGLHTPTAQEIMRGDVAPLVNGVPAPDGTIDISDALVILQKVVGAVNW